MHVNARVSKFLTLIHRTSGPDSCSEAISFVVKVQFLSFRYCRFFFGVFIQSSSDSLHIVSLGTQSLLVSRNVLDIKYKEAKLNLDICRLSQV